MTIKQHLEELPEPYNWLALERIASKEIGNTYDVSQSEALKGAFIWLQEDDILDFDFWLGIYDNLKHLGK